MGRLKTYSDPPGFARVIYDVFSDNEVRIAGLVASSQSRHQYISTNGNVKQIYEYQSDSYNSAFTEKSTRSPSDSRNENKNCKPPKPKCTENEIEVACVNSVCEYRNCSDIGKPIKCVRLDTKKCLKGCICKDKYLRDDRTGKCIPENQCPNNKCGPNEIYDMCPPTCPPQRCDVDERVIRCAPNPKPGDEACRPGCRCIDDYKRNTSGVCIPKEECAGKVLCGPNEIISSCVNGGCGRWNCSQTGEICIKLPEGACRVGCHCKDLYLRADNGTCIPENQCPSKIQPTCGPDEEYNECANGGCGRWECSQQGPLCIDLVEGGCVPGCRCAEPLLRAHNGSCVPADQCPPPTPPISCGPDEEYNECANGGCGRWECSQQGILCVDLVEGGCVPGCRCAEPLLRADDGTCVSSDQCPPYNCGLNEIYDICPPTCPPPRCDFDETVALCLPNPEPGDENCKPGCRCIDNYKQNASGVCIPKEECPPTPPSSCRPDEVYNECANGGCGRWECWQQGEICIDPKEGGCVPGCRCAEPLLRAEDGTCVPADQCPPVCNGQNEVAGCHTLCPETCESIGKNCTIIEQEICTSVCRCKSGFYRNKIGECISKEQCLKCTGPHEYFSCGSACDNVCENLSTQNQTNCPIKNIVCNQKCYCEENFARNSDNICIPIKDCRNKESGIQKFTEGNNVFNGKFLKVASDVNAESSVIYSPFSLLFLLAQLALYATGISKQQLFNVLNLQSENLIRSTIPLYLDEFNSQINVSLDLAERVYSNIQYKFSKKFLKDTKNIFKAEAQNLDFRQSSQAAKTINDWIALQTHDLIQNTVSPDTLNSNTRLVLVNAIYFQGNWIYPFPKKNTKQRDFYINKNKTVKVNMMNQIGSFNYAEINKPNIQILELPYENRNLTYLVCLPKYKDGIDELINALEDSSFSVIKTAILSLKSRRMDVSIPSMEITTTTDLENILRKLNVTAIFDPETADLRRILEKPEQLFVSSATQKATIIVNETGTKAAAANVINIRALAAPLSTEVIKFNANHPYVYFILYQGTPIFCGIYKG
ncbi:unnamed protein product [Euphydryas editha]|uniref:Serpin domain-containing protein n=1 Tax=Euphydryas editha TaxID=104508 RepID=A0AAU9VBL9_EUPED|nr:unnamed protein product [Euphydryas editha]